MKEPLFLALNLSPNTSQFSPTLRFSVYFSDAQEQGCVSTCLFINPLQSLLSPGFFSCIKKCLSLGAQCVLMAEKKWMNDAVICKQCLQCCSWDETNSHGLPSPVEEKGRQSHSLKGRAPRPLPCGAFIAFRGTLHWGWSSFTMHRFALGAYRKQRRGCC